jgi:hypothetical protein
MVRKLTAAQAALLETIKAAGVEGTIVPPRQGKTRTALMNRALIEWTSTDSSDRTVRVPWHEHQWKPVIHLDGCHFYRNSYACECGATAGSHHERNPNPRADPYALGWMGPTEPTEDEPCARCEALKAGARPLPYHLEIVGADPPSEPALNPRTGPSGQVQPVTTDQEDADADRDAARQVHP